MTKKKVLKLSAVILSIVAGVVSIIDAVILIEHAREAKYSITLSVVDPRIYTTGYIAIVAIIFWAIAIISGITLCLTRKESKILPIVTICLLSSAMILNIIIAILLFLCKHRDMVFQHMIMTIILSAAVIVLLCIQLKSRRPVGEKDKVDELETNGNIT